MMNLLTDENVIWAGIAVCAAVLAWIWWPKKKVTEALEEAAAATPEPVKVEPQITDAVTQAPAKKAKKAPAKKAPVKKPAAPKKAPAKKAVAKKGRK
jgi:hypothetical protein